jgi:N-acetylmuramoyl-L-alanine amidase
MNARRTNQKAVLAICGLCVAVGTITGLGRSRSVQAAGWQARQCVVAFDPGHGGRDSGAVREGIREKDINWKVANLAAEVLHKQGFGAVIDRAENQNPGFGERVSVASRAKAALMVSIHTNSYADASAQGTEAFYQPKGATESRRLAQLLMDTVASRAGTSSRGLKVGKSPFPYAMPSALIELAFLSNENERNMLVNTPDLFAQAIAEAVIQFTEGKCSIASQPTGGFKSGDIVSLKTEGGSEGARWLDGITSKGTVGLAQSLEAGYSGTKWQLVELGGGTFGLMCLGHVQGPRWLEGRSGDGTVGLAPDTNGGHSGTRWLLMELGGGAYGLVCQGYAQGPCVLEGFSGDGTVGLANNIRGGNPGTRWQIGIAK